MLCSETCDVRSNKLLGNGFGLGPAQRRHLTDKKTILAMQFYTHVEASIGKSNSTSTWNTPKAASTCNCPKNPPIKPTLLAIQRLVNKTQKTPYLVVDNNSSTTYSIIILKQVSGYIWLHENSFYTLIFKGY
jgi:hypothetical protein